MQTATESTQTKRAREYETIYIMRSTVHPDEADRIAKRVQEVIDARGGKLLRVDNWGRRRLAYPIHKMTRGVFVYIRYAGFSDLVAELERNLRLIDDVVRYLTVQLNERVSLTELATDPEELKFHRLEETAPEDEQEQELAVRLGLVERPRHEGSSDDSDSDDRSDDRFSDRPSRAEAKGAEAKGADAEGAEAKGDNEGEQPSAEKSSSEGEGGAA